MRSAFIATLTELAGQDERIALLTGDLGFMALEPFMEKYPERFFNVGVAEQNMIGLATGLAEAGYLPFVYSIVTFATLRPYEFIRNGPVLHHLPVRIVGVGGGLEYGHAGPTHHGLEDVAILRVQPGLTIIAPADPHQTRTALRATWDLPGPVYYRIGKNDKAFVPGLEGKFELGRLQILRQGGDLLLIALGGIANEAAAAAQLLEAQGIACTVAVLASVNPAPEADLRDLLARFPLALTVEAHSINGGLGSLVAEIAAEHGLGSRILRCGVRRSLEGLSGSQAYLQSQHGISADKLAETVLQLLNNSPKTTGS